ncbi:MAG: tyrosine-type recombinase/integrase [Propioniciclava sp.]|uniref:tyrosine-type recombinase/integrase n=1 Tax=Propioniciclava sp. TaxID=2038686 RepID=UPI0039E52A51
MQLVEWAARQVWSRETRRSVYAGVRAFYRWAVGAGLIGHSPADGLPAVRASDPCPRPTPDDVHHQALADADPRTWIILRLAAEAGLRRGEIARVHARDLWRDLAGWSLTVHGKGGKTRVVPLTDALADALRVAIAAAGGGWVLPGDVDGHLSPRWVGTLAARVLPGAWTLHSLRHRFATRAHDATHDLIAVQRLLGHASVATTQRYVASSQDALRRAAAAAA